MSSAIWMCVFKNFRIIFFFIILMSFNSWTGASELKPESLRSETNVESVEVDADEPSQNTVPILGKMVDFGESSREVPSKERKKGQKEEKSEDLISKQSENSAESSYLFIEKPLTNITKDSGENVKMRCEVQGRPPPKIRWYKNEAPLEPERGKTDVRKYSSGHGKMGSRLRILDVDIHDTGYYKCEASNDKHIVETTGILVVKAGRLQSPSIIPNFPPPFPHFPALGGRLPEFEHSDLGFCQHYRGVACSQLIGNKTVYVKSSLTLNQMEEKLAAIFTILASTGKDMSPECHKYAVPFFCHVLFPPCDDTVPYPVPRHVCRDDCDTLELATCKEELRTARRHPATKELVPDCEELPKEGGCVSLSVPSVVQVDLDATCYEGRGEGYRGPVSHTASSHQCQNWDSKAEFEELAGGHNYCRNPEGKETQPWCFIADPHIRKEFCDIPKCTEYAWVYIFLPSAVAALLLGVLLGLWCKRQRRKTCPSKLSPTAASAQLIPIHLQSIEMQQKALPRIPLGIHEVSQQSIRFLQELGDGVFGKVFRGEMHHPRTASGGAVVTPVAIKTLSEGSGGRQSEWVRAVETAAALQHPNVVCLVAVCAREEPLCMLFEYRFRCDLHEFLLMHSPHSPDADQLLEVPDFLVIAMQVAAGMEYLSSKRYVHRDLAARNCLVSLDPPPTTSLTCLSASLTVKISDLGVSRHSCASEYFRIRNALLPVRWMAPESLLYGTFTTESDVWAFGVLLWEIFSYGTRPYFNRDHQEVIDLVCSHQLLPRPEHCPPHAYAVMNDCWHDSPSHRPSFKEIFNRLCSVQGLHERTFSVSHSVLSGSHSTGPSNKTLSTNLSLGRSRDPFCGAGTGFVPAKMIPPHRTHQCEQV